jgi:hypothetical protein
MPEFIELTDEELAIVAGGVSLTGGASTGFTGGIGTSVMSVADTKASQTTAINGGSVGAATLDSFILQAAPPGS